MRNPPLDFTILEGDKYLFSFKKGHYEFQFLSDIRLNFRHQFHKLITNLV